MHAYYGEITGTKKSRAQLGDVVEDYDSIAEAYRAAVRLTGGRKYRVQKTVFPAPAPAVEPERKTAWMPALEAYMAKVTVSALVESLETGDHDRHLESLLALERAGRERKTAIKAVEDRMKALNAGE